MQTNKKITEYPLKNVKISELKFDKTNPNQLTQQQMHGLRRSMERFGYLVPIVITKDYEIADGEHRALIYKEFGLKEIPAYVVDLKDDSERRLLRQTMNKLRGQHEEAMDADEIAILYESNQIAELSTLIAQQQDDILAQLEKYKPEIAATNTNIGNDLVYDDNAIAITDAELQKPAITQVGDIWQLGEHRLMCGDSTKKEDMDKLIQGKKAAMVFTDPPYNIMGSSNGMTKTDDDNMIRPFFRSLANMVRTHTKTDGHIYICCNWRSYLGLALECRTVGLTAKNLIVWHKPNVRLGNMYTSSHEFIYFLSNEAAARRMNPTINPRKVRTVMGETNVWVYSLDLSHEREHFAVKPLVLPERAIKNSTDENELVFDLFMGSGTTLLAAQKLGRICYGMEIEPKYCDVTIKRWETATGMKAVRVGDSTTA